MIKYQKLLVALDGSEQAAEALLHVSTIASQSGAAVVLLRVVHSLSQLEIDPATSPVEGRAEYSQDVLAETRQEEERLLASKYLEETRQSLSGHGLAIETRVREGEPASEILAESTSNGVDIIVMTAYGQGGAHVVREEAVFGSVADAVLRRSKIPVLVVRPNG